MGFKYLKDWMKPTLTVRFCLFVLLLSGCSSQPTVYLYSKYLDESQVDAFTSKLEANAFNVKRNSYDFPISIEGNTILYSLLLEDPEVLSKAENVAETLNMPISRTQGMTEGNHWYTKNALAMFLMPENEQGRAALYKQDLMHEFRLVSTDECSASGTLTLSKNGSYSLTLDKTSKPIKESLIGTWHYRQHPFLELRPTSADYAMHYFEISQQDTQDQISAITFTRLSTLSSSFLASNCVFEFGIRR